MRRCMPTNPEIIRGLLNFNHPDTLRKIIQEVGPEMSNESQPSDDGVDENCQPSSLAAARR